MSSKTNAIENGEITQGRGLKQKCLDYLYSIGLNSNEADHTLASLIYAEQRDVKSHGLNRIFSGFIQKLIDKNLCESGSFPYLLHQRDGYFMFDGNYSVGYSGIRYVLSDLIKNYSHRDFIFCNVKNLYPTNCLTEYVELLCNEGFICYMTSKSPNKVLPPVGFDKGIKLVKPIVGTNAYAWGFPGMEGRHSIFDATMAASTNGDLLKPREQFAEIFKAESFLTKDFIMPEKVDDIFDEGGNFSGYILPFGAEKNYKGFGNLITAELFDIFQDENKTETSTTIIAIKVRDIDAYKDRLEVFRKKVNESLVYHDGETARLPFENIVKDEDEVFQEYEQQINALMPIESSVNIINLQNDTDSVLISPGGRKIESETPGGELLQSIISSGQVLAYGGGTPYRALLLEQMGLDTVWVSSFELSALLGEKDDESIGFSEVDFFVDRVSKKCPNAKMIIDCDTGWTNDGQLLAQYFRSWRSTVAAVVVQNLKTGLKENSFLSLDENCLESHETIAQKVNIIGKECSNALVCLRIENLIVGQSVDAAIDYVCKVWELGGNFDVVVVHNKLNTLKPLEDFSKKFYEVMPKDVLLMAIPTAYIEEVDLLERLKIANYQLVVLANYAVRGEYEMLLGHYGQLAKGKYKEVNGSVAPMSDIFNLVSGENSSLNSADEDIELESSKSKSVQMVAANLIAQLKSEHTHVPDILRRLLDNDVPYCGEFFEEWGKSDYDLVNLPDHKRLMKSLRTSMAFDKSDKILDVGCGTGEALDNIDKADNVVCLDRSEAMLAKLVSRAEKYDFKIKTECIDLLNYSTDNQFDKVIAIMSLHHIPHIDKQAAINKLTSLMKPGGQIFIGETFFDTTNLDSVEKINAVTEWYSRKIQNCVVHGCYGHAIRDVEILRRILYKKGEYMVSLRNWRRLLERAGLKVSNWEMTSNNIKYGYILAEKPVDD